ncbi:MAG: SusC/RagA family TonB-linked outer membrane protein, partial [Paramuribaculum sp.]|nr:SusC/RagA family TonB-linked outer membrane protein [Paramuribaculum sp.]
MDKSILRQWLATILIVVICPLLATAQNQTTVNISAKDTPVKTVLRQIESQTTYRFSYTAGLLDGFPRQTLEYNNTPVATVLDKVFGNSPIAYDIVSPKAIALYKRGAEPRKTTKGTKDGKTVKGQILDSTGEPVIGATVWIKGTQKRMATNIDGEYSFADVEPGQEIVVTSVGYDPTSIAVGDKETYNLTLDSSANNLDEVVVVGYGAQKKINLTGSVATVQSKQLESRATTNLSNALAGVASGVSVSQTSGKPGSDGSNITIRGIGTFNSSYLAPLVIVDGSEASIGSVNSDDVESISVLKDAASAAIYGSRGANGVILITTKKGRKGQAPTVTYTGLITNSKMSGKAFRFEDNYAEYMEMANRWNTNRNYQAATKYTQTDIDEWRTGLANAAANPNGTDNPYGVPNFLAYPSTQWVDEMFLPSTSQKHNVSVVGSSNNSNYLLSLGYLDNPGTLENTGLKNYSGRINLESDITKFLTIGTQTYATFQRREPGNTNFTYMFQNTPAMTPYYNGMYGVAVDGSSPNNLLAAVVNNGGHYDDTRLNTTWFA